MELECGKMSSIGALEFLMNAEVGNKNFDEACMKYAQDISFDKLSIHEFVENIGSLLTNSSTQKREKGTKIFSTVLSYLPKDQLNEQNLEFIATFFQARLKEHHQVIPAVLEGISALISFKHLSRNAPVRLVCEIFQNVPCQQQQRKDRLVVYEIIKEIHKNFRSEILALKLDFVVGLISALDSERDPRNLLFIFKWLPEVLPTLQLAHLDEEMFSTISCYFPVDFRPPEHGDETITREDLAKALEPCLCSVPEFASLVLPLIIDKLQTSLEVAKMDSLKLLIACCGKFPSDAFVEFAGELWSLLQAEVLNSKSNDTLQVALSAVTELARATSSENSSSIVVSIMDSVKNNLKPDTKMFSPSLGLITALSAANLETYKMATALAMPLLVNQFNISWNNSHQALLLRGIMQLVKVAAGHGLANILTIREIANIPLICSLAVAKEDSELRALGFDSLSFLVSYMPDNLRSDAYGILRQFLTVEQSKPVRTAVLNCLRSFAEKFPSEVLHSALPNTGIDTASIQLYLEAICFVLPLKEFRTDLTTRLLDMCTSSNASTCFEALKCIRNLLESNESNSELLVCMHTEFRMVEILLNWLMRDLREIPKNSCADAVESLKILIGSQTAEEQRWIVREFFPKIYPCNESDNFMVVTRLESLLMRMRRDVAPISVNLLAFLVKVCIASGDNEVSCAQLLANLINKWTTSEVLSTILDLIEREVLPLSVDQKTRFNQISLLCWTTKSLAAKGHSVFPRWIKMMVSLLDVTDDIAVEFGVLVDDRYECISDKSYCNVRLFYRQHVLSIACQEILKKVSNDKSNTNSLLALGYLIYFAPRKALRQELKNVCRLSILSLERIEHPEVLCGVLDTFSELLASHEPKLENCVEELLPRVLKLSAFQPSMKVRIAALRCAQNIPAAYPVYKLLPLKQMCLQDLEACLDDKKRLVRREAVSAISLWHMLDAPFE